MFYNNKGRNLSGRYNNLKTYVPDYWTQKCMKQNLPEMKSKIDHSTIFVED